MMNANNESCVLSALQIHIAKALTSISISEAMPLEAQRRAPLARHMTMVLVMPEVIKKNRNWHHWLTRGADQGPQRGT